MMEENGMKIVDGKEYIDQVKELIIEYMTRLGRDLSFQNIESELQDPTIKYTAPQGELLVALNEDQKVIGMVAYHRHTHERCEMKRLYVNPQYRGLGLGDQLVKEIIEHAQKAGYKEMVLDTIIPLQGAIYLYKKYGFLEVEAYYDNPMEDVIYMKKILS